MSFLNEASVEGFTILTAFELRRRISEIIRMIVLTGLLPTNNSEESEVHMPFQQKMYYRQELPLCMSLLSLSKVRRGWDEARRFASFFLIRLSVFSEVVRLEEGDIRCMCMWGNC